MMKKQRGDLQMDNLNGTKARKLALLLGASLGIVATSAWADEQAPAAGANDDGAIIVTAQKRDQRLLDVPVPVSTVSSDTLIAQNLTNFQDYFVRIPGIQYGGTRVQYISIRGITTGGATNPTVALLVDDVPFGSATVNGSSLIPDFDPAILERVEVLRGPQGTLYGAASLGGLIKYVTKQPSTTDFSGTVQAGVASVAHGGLGNSVRGSVNIPIVENKVGLSVSGFYRRDPAYVDNIDSGTGQYVKDANKFRSWGGRAALLIQPVDGLSVTLSAMRQLQRTSNSGAVDFTSETDFSGILGNDLVVRRALGQPSRNKFDLYSAKVDLDLGFATLTSVSGWNVSEDIPLQDVSNAFPFMAGFYPGTNSVFLTNSHRTTRFSQELRLSGGNAMFDWLVGGFYSVEHANISQTMMLADATGAIFDQPYDGSGPSSYREFAGFADLTVHLSERFDVQFGGRFAHNKQINQQVTTITGAAQNAFGQSTFEESRQSEDAFTWVIAPSYHITPDMMVYARVATGYRPGGTNSLLEGVPKTYGSDRVTNYEAGFKGTALDRMIDYDLSLFQIDWKDIQLQSTSSNNFTYTTNGGKARSRGVELTTNIRPWQGGAINLNGAYTDAVLSSNLPDGATTIGQSGDRLPNSAKFSGTIGFDQQFPLGNGITGSIGANYTYVGNRYVEFLSTEANAGAGRVRMPSYDQVDIRAGIALDSGWRLDGYVRNLLDERGVLLASTRGGTSVNYGRYITPRTIGFVVTGQF